MKINIKSKLYIGLGLLAAFVVVLWISGSVFINTLAENSGAIIEDNIRTVTYVQEMEKALNDIYTSQVASINNPDATEEKSYLKAVNSFENILSKQKDNITEAGEHELTQQIDSNYRDLLESFSDTANETLINAEFIDRNITPAYLRLQQNLSQLTNMNVDAIHRKNDRAQQTAYNVTIYMSAIGALCSLLGILMLIKFPGYIVDPIHQLIERIKAVSNRNYDHTLEFHSGDEYEELASAFNSMARKLQEYENSNLDRIMSEKKRVETIINNMSDAVIGLDADNYILFANDKAIELLGRTKDELIGLYAPDVASTNDLLHKMISKLEIESPSNDTSTEENETSYINAGEGNEHYYTIETIPVLHNQTNGTDRESHLGNIITLKNVTRFHELDEAKTNFLSVVSHELKTPISSIKMSLRLLEDERVGNLSNQQRELTSSIRKDITRMKRTTSELLDLSKIESGNIQLDTGEVQPADLLEYAFGTMVMQATQNDLELNIDIEDNLPKVKADSQKTIWVLINLISNAIRYTEPGGHITLKACRDKDSRFVQFSVEDSGEGINPDYLEKIFEKYFQVDKSRKDRTGTGLGLSIAREFINAQGGKIWAESEPGIGSRFYFILPIS